MNGWHLEVSKKDHFRIVEKKFILCEPVQATSFSKSGCKSGSDDLDFFTFSYYLQGIVPANVCYVLSAM